MAGFVDEAQLHVKAGDGGAGRWPSDGRPTWTGAGPTGVTAGHGGSVWLVATTNQSSLLAFRDHPHRRGVTAATVGARRSTAPGAPTSRCPSRSGPGPERPTGRSWSIWSTPATDGWPGRAAEGGGQRQLPLQPSPGTFLRRAGGEGPGAVVRPRAGPGGGRGPGGLPQRGQVTLISRISAANPRSPTIPSPPSSPTWAWCGATTAPISRWPTSPVWWRVPPKARARPPVPPAHHPGPGAGHAGRARPGDRHRSRRQQRVLLDELERYQPGLIERPRLVVGTKVDVLTGGTGGETGVDGAGTDMNISAVTGQGINQLVGKLAVLVAEARADEPVDDGTVVIHRPAARGFHRRAGR
jgi:GTP-binding protein